MPEFLRGDTVAYRIGEHYANSYVADMDGEFLKLRNGYWIHEDQVLI